MNISNLIGHYGNNDKLGNIIGVAHNTVARWKTKNSCNLVDHYMRLKDIMVEYMHDLELLSIELKKPNAMVKMTQATDLLRMSRIAKMVNIEYNVFCQRYNKKKYLPDHLYKEFEIEVNKLIYQIKEDL